MVWESNHTLDGLGAYSSRNGWGFRCSEVYSQANREAHMAFGKRLIGQLIGWLIRLLIRRLIIIIIACLVTGTGNHLNGLNARACMHKKLHMQLSDLRQCALLENHCLGSTGFVPRSYPLMRRSITLREACAGWARD